MMRIEELPKSLERESPEEFSRFREFLLTHSEKRTTFEDRRVGYCVCGSGRHMILTFAGGWGGIEMLYETILGFQRRNRMVIVDISEFRNAEEMDAGVNQVLDKEGIDDIVLMGQSLAGILAQIYFRRQSHRVKALILTNTLAPKPERCRKPARIVFSCLPFPLLRVLMRWKLGQMAKLETEIPPAVLKRRQFVQKLFARNLARFMTRKQMKRLLDLAWSFNQDGPYRADEFQNWPGRILIINSPDDPNNADATILKSSLPATQQIFLPSGYGHMAPQICREEFQATVQQFIDEI